MKRTQFRLYMMAMIMLHSSINAENWITIFVHGTFGLSNQASFSTFFTLLTDSVEGSSYERNVMQARQDPTFFSTQPMQELGLRPVKYSTACHSGSYIFSTLFNYMLHMHSEQFTNTRYYTFGWSGLVSVTKRFKEAYVFYVQLRNELAAIKAKTGIIPKIRLIAYSHGGNVCLNLARIRKIYYPHDSFIIDDLTIIGMPVQHDTERLVHEPIFKEIFNISSTGDSIQRLDIFGPCNVISYKHFHGCRKYPLPTKLTQITLSISSASSLYKQSVFPNYGNSSCVSSRALVNASPNHIELWFFGWTAANYRSEFPFYPLPVALFIPYITATAKKYAPGVPLLSMHIQPSYERTLINHAYTCVSYSVPFMTTDQLKILTDTAFGLKPKDKFITTELPK